MMGANDALVRLDLNNPVFQETLFNLQKAERHAAIDTLKKVRQLTWAQAYRDNGLKWEKIVSVQPPAGIDAIYSLRITQSRRVTAWRDGDFVGPEIFISANNQSLRWRSELVEGEVAQYESPVWP